MATYDEHVIIQVENRQNTRLKTIYILRY